MGSTMTIGKRFTITSGILVLLSTVLALVATISLSGIDKDTHSLATDTVPGIVYASAIRGDVFSLRGDYFRHIQETDPSEIAKQEQSIAKDDDQLAEDIKGYEKYISSGEDHQQFDAIKTEIAAFQQGWVKVLPISRAGQNADAYALYKSEMMPRMDVLKVSIVKLVDWNRKGADGSLLATGQTVQSSWWLTLVLGIVVVVVGIGLSWFMIAALNKELTSTVAELSEGAVQIASAASQVASSSQSLAQGSSEQAASLEETSSTTEEINSMAGRNTENSGVMSQMVTDSQLQFTSTNRQLGEMVTAMDEINASSGKISKIIKVIDDIAFQTNILALNAAVEAARAGEAGMGFAVVAEEVRNLAHRSAQAAKDTAELIEDSIGKSGSGKDKVGLVAAAIHQMTEEFTKIKTLVDEVSQGSKQQTDGIGQVRRALSQMELVSQGTAASAEEGAAAAEQLNAQSEALKAIVVRLNSMAGSNASIGF